MTSDDRRAVAASLREQADEGYGVNLESMAYALGLDSDDGECGDEDVFNMLADLIDPTCHAVRNNPPADDEFVCSECGALVGIEDMFMSNHCEKCGARVVTDDE